MICFMHPPIDNAKLGIYKITFSALDMTWWIENTSPVEEMLIQVMENQLSRSPDCSSERIEIYRGKQMIKFCVLCLSCPYMDIRSILNH